jgi:F-type H+-transporting ATPase subunit b
MICFWLTLWLVHRFLIVPMRGVLEERSGRIDGAEKEWAAKTAELEAASKRLQDEIDDAARSAAKTRDGYRQEAQDARQTKLDAAREQADGQLRKALAELSQDAENARNELRQQANKLAGVLAAKLLGREVAS